MFVPDALSRAFMGPDAHPTGVLATIELEAPLTGVSVGYVGNRSSTGSRDRPRSATASFETEGVQAEE